MQDVQSPAVLARREGRLGRITLNRPAALNALTLGMIREISQTLHTWETEPGLALVVLDGAGERGFCAGGDLRTLYEAAHGDPEPACTLWREEYRLDAYLARYPRPVVALMDGLVMGGGLGLTAHGRIRVVTERTVLAMPEVGIGLAPDVGGNFLLAQAPGELGTHLALTGAHIGAEDALLCRLADHIVPAQQLDTLVHALRTEEPSEAIAKLGEPNISAGQLATDRPWIDECYTANSLANLLARLRTHGHPAARQAAATIEAASPTAVAVTLHALRRARTLPDLESCLEQDYRISRRFLDHPDLPEGIRAALIDKDHRPRWNPDRLDKITTTTDFFRPLPDGELHLPRYH